MKGQEAELGGSLRQGWVNKGTLSFLNFLIKNSRLWELSIVRLLFMICIMVLCIFFSVVN